MPEAQRVALDWGGASDDGGGDDAKARKKPSRQIRIDEVRVAIDWVVQSSSRGRAKVIVLHPADDYISTFVKDVNRGRVIRCRTLMTKGPRVQGPDVDPSLIIEEAARLLSPDNTEAANVVTAKGKHLGVISMNDIIGAIVPPAPPA